MAEQAREELEELSVTLIERRKRLHELATEINQWQDESNKHLLTPTAIELLGNKTLTSNSAHASPKTTIIGLSPSSFINSNNKENKTPTNSTKRIVTPSSNEILCVAQRILAKRQSNSENSPSSLVKTMRSKFENNNDENQVQTELLPPKLLIKKFEQMSKEAASNPTQSSLNTQISAKKLTEKKQSIVSQPPASTHPVVASEADHIKPKNIIEKFEQLVKIGGNGVAEKKTPANPQPTYSGVNSSMACSASLTYVSSIQSSANNSPDLNEYFDYEKDAAGNLNNADSAKRSSEMTSLFEHSTSLSSSPDSTSASRQINYDESGNQDEESEETTEYSTQDAYSISGSSYTGSLINQDEFESTYDDEYDSINDDGQQEEEEDEYESEMDDVETTLRQNAKSPDTTQTTSDCGGGTTSSAETASTSSGQTSNHNLIESEPLFSIQEYRKQTRTIRNHGRRRSSLATKGAAGMNSSGKESNNKGGVRGGNASKMAPLLSSISENSEEQNKKLKYLERIKELEEFIKQEDNVIYQTGIALEKCLTDSQFTGSSEHIECNRILLISCQKRQAFLTEVNRLKQLASNPNIQNSRSQSSNETGKTDSYDISSSDLTGLLIFSDLQLPIKEPYINKLKSGDEKRVFYFICLIRNGIQVLQTQVISVQELIPTKETCITFPNRMAINNVDINFKVKIDIYAMEVLPKDHKTIKHTHHSSCHSTSKFFSPFKNNLFHHISSSHSNQQNANNNAALLMNNNSSNSHHSNAGISSLGAKTSNFIHIDTVEITNRDIYSNKFKLNISSSSIPLSGSLFVNVRCMPSKSIELKGFMTLFEDINGLGSWDRRWCFLNNYSISFWKYPEDEYRNGPLGTINLTKCINETVNLLPRDLCARKYTIELIIYDTENSSLNDDSSTKTICSNEKFKYKRYRLSADTKDQANDWLTNINYALANLRIWNPKAQKPTSNTKK